MPFDEGQAVHALTVLTRLAQREQDVDEWILRALRADPAGWLGPAIQVGVETGAPMPAVVNQLLGEVELPADVLLTAWARIPAYTSGLRATAALITGMLLDSGAVTGTPAGVALAAEHVERLLETGDRERAVRMARETLILTPSQVADDPLLAWRALRVLSACLAEAGDHAEAVRTAEEAINLVAPLRDLGVPTAEGAIWYTLGERLMAAQRTDRALAAFDRAVAAYDALIGSPATAAAGEPIGELYYQLALALLGQAQILDSLGRSAEGLSGALRAVRILRERAAESPDTFGLIHAMAVMVAMRCLSGARDRDPGRIAAAAPLVLPDLMDAAWQVLRDAGVRRRPDEVRDRAAYVVDIATAMSGADPGRLIEVTNALVDLGLEWLAGDRPEEAGFAAAAAVASAEALVERFGDADRLPLRRALMARSRVRERAADVEAALADAADAVRIAEHALERVAASHSQSLRLANAGRVDEAFAAEREAVLRLIPVYEPDRTDLVFTAVHMTGRLFRLAEQSSRLAELDGDVLRFAVAILESFPGHRAEHRILDDLAYIGFGSISAYARRSDVDRVATAHQGLIALTARYPDAAALRRARLLAASVAVRCYLRADRLDLATAAYEDMAALAGADADDVTIVEQARCANAILNVLVDIDFARASDFVHAAGPALRSPAYLAALTQLGEDDPAGYLEWLDQIASGHGVRLGADTDPSVLAALAADHRATLAERLRTMGEDHPATLAVRLNLAEILRWRGLTGEAAAELTAALASCRRVRGADHPDTRAIEERLADL